MQNAVGELWALFDFLMPGLLGSERQFNARYGRTLQVGMGLEEWMGGWVGGVGGRTLQVGCVRAACVWVRMWAGVRLCG